MKHMAIVALFVLTCFSANPPRNLAATFEILFPAAGVGGEKSVLVSDDGSIVLGAGGHPSYVWENSKGITYQSIGHDDTYRVGMSGDGKTILSFSVPTTFRPTDASFDGGVVTAVRNIGNDHLTVDAVGIIAGQSIGLGKLAPGDTGSRAWAVSADGSTIVGATHAHFVSGVHYGIYRMTPFRWTGDTGMVSLGSLPGSTHPIAHANDVSGDGSVIVGQAALDNRSDVAFRWTESAGMQSLGDLPGGAIFSEAFAVSANGKVIVGSGYAEPHLGGGLYDLYSEAFIWTEHGGMQDLRELLINDYKLDLQNYRLRSATGVSANGNLIVGWGEGSGSAFAWRINLVPEPAALTLLFSVTMLHFRRRR